MHDILPLPPGALYTHRQPLSSVIDGNSLDGSIPPEVTKLTSLRVLDMNFNDNISGPLPTDLGNLSLLQQLAFSHNQLTGRIPDSLCDAQYLQQIYLRYNQLSSEIPKCLGSLQNLKILQVSTELLRCVKKRWHWSVWLNLFYSVGVV